MTRRNSASLVGAAGIGLLGVMGGCDGKSDPAQAITGSVQAGKEHAIGLELKSAADLITTHVVSTGQWPTVDEYNQMMTDAGTPPTSFLDPWKNPYVYQPPARRGEQPKLFSMGRDGMPNTSDDVPFTNWQPNLGG